MIGSLLSSSEFPSTKVGFYVKQVKASCINSRAIEKTTYKSAIRNIMYHTVCPAPEKYITSPKTIFK